MAGDAPGVIGPETVLRVDGGMVANDWMLQNLADILGQPVDRPQTAETTALGAAYLGGLAVGLYPEPERFAESWARERRFNPTIDAAHRSGRREGWRQRPAAYLDAGAAMTLQMA